MKTINREKIERMVGRGTGGGGGGGRGVDLAGYASQAWVEQQYISKEFFLRLFSIHGHNAEDTSVNPEDIIIEPNDTDEDTTVLDSIEAKAGLWTNSFVSALGLNPAGGGTGDILSEPLLSINSAGLGHPTRPNVGIVWDGTRWVYGETGGDNIVTTNTAQTITGVKTFNSAIGVVGGLTPIAAGQVNTVSGAGRLWIKKAKRPEGSSQNDGTPNNGMVFECGSGDWVGRLYMADNGKDGLYFGGVYEGVIQEWRKLAFASQLDNYVTLTTAQTITGLKTFEYTVNNESTPLLKLNDKGAVGQSRMIWALRPNMTSQQWGEISVGKSATSKNLGQLAYKHVGDGSNNNFISLGIYGVGAGLCVYGNRSVYIGGSVDEAPSSTLHVNGTFYASGNSSIGGGLDVSGPLKAGRFLTCHNANASAGTAGWLNVAIITVTSSWANQPLKFRVTQRERNGGEITIRFTNVQGLDPQNLLVSEFFYTGDIVGAVVVQSGNTFSLYIQKSEPYENIGISLVDYGGYAQSSITVTWTDGFSSSQPSGTVASCRYYFASNVYMEYDVAKEGVHVVNGGLYTDKFVSTLGAGTSGSSGGDILLQPLSDINGNVSGTPTNGSVIMYTGSGWAYRTIGSTGITSITLETPTGFYVNNSTSANLAANGTFKISLGGSVAANSVLAAPSSGNGTPSWRKLVAADIQDLSSTYLKTDGTAARAAKLSDTTAFQAWGQTFFTGGMPQNVSGAISGATTISASSNVTVGGALSVSGDATLGSSLDFRGGGSMRGLVSIELNNHGELVGYGGFIDFHYNGSSADYTSRIIEDASGRLAINSLLYVLKDGNVGIGTTNPTAKLEVNGSVKIGGATLTWDSDNQALKIDKGFYSDSFVSALGANASGGSGGGTTLTEPLLSINTSTLGNPSSHPNQTFVYNGGKWIWSNELGATITAYNMSAYSITGSYISGTNIVGSGKLTVGQSSLNTSYQLYVNGSSLFNGNVGIGGYDNACKLYVSGKVKFSKMIISNTTNPDSTTYTSLGVSDSLNVSVTGSANINKAWVVSSDMRLKDVCQHFDIDITSVAKAPLFTYRLKNSGSQLMVGTSAQYWMDKIPETVTLGYDGYYGLDYNGVLTASVISVARKVVDHEVRVKQLEERIAELENEINELKAA